MRSLDMNVTFRIQRTKRWEMLRVLHWLLHVFFPCCNRCYVSLCYPIKMPPYSSACKSKWGKKIACAHFWSVNGALCSHTKGLRHSVEFCCGKTESMCTQTMSGISEKFDKQNLQNSETGHGGKQSESARKSNFAPRGLMWHPQGHPIIQHVKKCVHSTLRFFY